MPAATAVKERANNVTTLPLRDMPYEFEVLPLKSLIIDVYQRPLTTFVKQIEADYNPALVGTLAVSERSRGKYAVIDGQTRAEGMRRVGLKAAPCLVFKNLTVEQEAELFALFQTQRRGMTSAALFNALVVSGKDHWPELNDLIVDAGFTVNDNVSHAQNAIAAVMSVDWVYWGCKKGKSLVAHPELVTMTLETIKDVWPKLPEGARGAIIIRGLGYYLHHNSEINHERLVDRLSRIQPSEVAKRAALLKESRGLSGNPPNLTAEAIANQYAKRG